MKRGDLREAYDLAKGFKKDTPLEMDYVRWLEDIAINVVRMKVMEGRRYERTDK